MMTHRAIRFSVPILAAICLLAAGVANAQRVTVTRATPDTAERQTKELLVVIEGKGFEAGSVVRFLLPGSKKDTGGVIVDDARTIFRHSTALGVYVDVDEFAILGDRDIVVTTSRGRGGKGTTLFRVLEKGGGDGSRQLLRVDFWNQGTPATPGIFDDAYTGYLCGATLFDYVDDEDSPLECAPDPGAQPLHSNSIVGSGGMWGFRLWEEIPGNNPRTVGIDFSGYADPTQCQRLNDELATMGLDCGCADASLEPACNVHMWINADNMFKSNATRVNFSRMDIFEVTGTDGADGPDLRIFYYDAPYICEAAGHEGNPDWRVIQTAPCGSANLETGSLADVVIPATGGRGQNKVIGQWLLPLQITGHRVPLPPDGACIDMDRDGVCVVDGDCDDTNPNVYPGHADVGPRWGGDGVDNDCDGVPDQ